MSINIKKCPLCEESDKNGLLHTVSLDGWQDITCYNCGLSLKRHTTEAQDAKKVQGNLFSTWDTRPNMQKAISLIEELLEDRCIVCKIHNPQHKDCTSCDDMDDYIKTFSEIKE